MTAQKWVVRLLGLATIAILTRYVSAADFGTVAAASTVLPFFYLLADLGFTAYTVQAEKTNPVMLSTSFWFSALAGVVLCGAMVAIAPLLGVVFRDAAVVPILQAQALWVVFTSLGAVPTALLRRSMRFGAIAGQTAAGAAVAQVVAIVMAVAGMGAWALVAQGLVSAAIMSTMAWISARWRPALTFSRDEFLRMTRFGGQVMGVEFVAMLRAWAEAAIISATLGMAAMGYLNIAQRLVQTVQDLTGGALAPVTSVAFARLRGTPNHLRDAYLRSLRITYAALSLPLTLVAIAAPLIVPILFGNGWTASFQVAQVLALAGTLTVGAFLDHGLYYGIGKPGAWFVYAIIVDGITVAGTALSAHYGLVAVAWIFLGVAVMATVVRWFLIARLLDTSPVAVARPFGFLVTAVLSAGAAGWGTMHVAGGLPPILAVALIGLAVLTVYFVVLRVMANQVIVDGLGFLRQSRLAKFLPSMRRGAVR